MKKITILITLIYLVIANSFGQIVGDVMPYYDQGSSKFYIYYLNNVWDDVTNKRHPWNALTTTDLSSYTEIGEKLSCSSDPCQQDFAVGTGSVIKEGSIYYAFYTGHNPNYPSLSCATTKEGVMLATSTSPDNGFTKSTSFTIIYPPSGYDPLDNFRDPFVYKEGTIFYMIVSARTSVNGTWKGVLAKYTSTNLTSWNYAGILYDGGSTNFFMMECAEIFKMENTYYLTFSDTNTKNVFYRKSSSVNGPWSNPVGVGTLNGVGYAARTASNGTARYILGWQVVGNTWAGQLIGKQLIQGADGDLIVTSIGSNVSVTGVSLTPTTATINVGATQQLTATVAPSNATNKTVFWSSSNTSIASVNSSGLVTGVASGSATITVTTQDGNKTSTSAISVNANTIPVSSVTVSPTTASLTVGATQQLTATVLPTNATNKNVSWASNNTAVAAVSSTGLVTAISLGTATISAITQDGNKTATCAVTVTSGSSSSPEISSGLYRIVSTHSGKAIDASGSTNGSLVQQWEYLGGANQKWEITESSESNYYTITVSNSGKVLDADGATNGANGTKIQVWSVLGGDNQKWQIVSAGSGYYKILCKNGGRAIEIIGSSMNNGEKLQLKDFIGAANQQWELIPLNTTIPVTGVTVSPTTASLSIGATQQLAATVLPTNATNKTISWSSSNTSIATVNSSGLFTAVAVGSATITVTTQDGNKIATCAITVTAGSGSSPEISSGLYKIVSMHSGKAMDASGSANGSLVQQWEYLGGANQKWEISESSESNYYTIKASNSGKALDADGATNGANGTKIQVWSDLGGDNQKWQIVSVGNDSYKILCKNGGRAVEIIGSNMNNGEKLQLKDFIGAANQQWYFELLSSSSSRLAKNTQSDAISTFSIYPNPVENILQTNYEGHFENALIYVFDNVGRIVLSKEISESNFDLDVSGLNRGVYFVHIQANNFIQTNKFVKN